MKPVRRPPAPGWWRRLTLRSRLALAATLAVALGIGLVTAVAYVAVHHELVAEVDRQLNWQAERLARQARISAGAGFPVLRLEARFGQPGGYAQVVSASGEVSQSPDRSADDGRLDGLPDGVLDGTDQLPVTAEVREVASGELPEYYSDTTLGPAHVRVLTAPLLDGLAIQVALPLEAVDRELERLQLAFLTAGLGGVGLAALLGWLVARTALRPVARLTEAAERVAVTRDLAHRIEVDRADELGRLAMSFNAMLEALDAALTAQRRLVADASHELRTPLTSLRTNVEVLARADALPPEDRKRLLADVVDQMEELSVLVSDVIDVARGEEPEALLEDVPLDELTSHAVERARRRWPAVTFVMNSDPTLVRGVATRLDRAVTNLLDNAAKFSPPGATVEVMVAGGEVAIRDHGPGIPPEDLPHVFDRFYRARTARGLTGSGLGLAIVRQVADSHHGEVGIGNADGGGALARLRFPPLSGIMTAGGARF